MTIKINELVIRTIAEKKIDNDFSNNKQSNEQSSKVKFKEIRSYRKIKRER